MTLIDLAAETRKARKLRARRAIIEIDYQRELVRLSKLRITQHHLSESLVISQPTLSSTLKTAKTVPPIKPGFSGATPYEIAQRYAAGELTKTQLIDELTRWEYPDSMVTDGYDSLLIDVPGSFDDVERALQDKLIDGETYDEILEALSGDPS
jgi:hypothetical protein